MARERPEPRRVSGVFFRQCGPGLAVDEVPEPSRQPPGRYNRRGDGTWYASSSPEGAWAEYYRHFWGEGLDPQEVRRCFGAVAVSMEVLDLTSEAVRRAIGVTLEELLSDDVTAGQEVADWARTHGFEGILAPSAAMEGAQTLAVLDPAVLDQAMVREAAVVQPPPDPRR